MENKLGKTIFGLLITAMLVITMIPATQAGLLPGSDLVNREFSILDSDSSKITLTVRTDDAGEDTVDVYIARAGATPAYEMIKEDVKIPNLAGGTWDIPFTLGELRALTFDVPSAETEYAVAITDANDPPTGTDLLNDNIWIETVSFENNIDTAMFNLDKVVDQTGKKDELNPGDKFDAYIEIDAGDDNTERTYHGMYLTGRLYDTVTGEFLGEDETTSFTLGDETQAVKVLSFSIPQQMSLTEKKDTERLQLVVEVNSYESTDDKNIHGNAILTGKDWQLTVEAKEDSLYIVDAGLSAEKVKAGESMSVDAELANDGVDTQDNVKVSIEIVGLGVKYAATIASIENDDSKIINAGLAIPNGAKAGTYDVKITAESEQGATASLTKSITVEGSSAPAKDNELSAIDDEKTLSADGTAKFTFEITNNGEDRQVYDLEVEGVDASLSKETLTVNAGETKEFTVTAKEAGEFTVNALIDGDVVASADASATAAASAATKEQVIQVLQWVFAVIIIVAIILVIVWAVTKGRKGNDKEVYY